MMPLIYMNPGDSQIIKKIGGSPEVKKHLEDLVISTLGGNLIVKVKESRVALDNDLARRIMV